jgi:chloramphenicol-sensitive protein RarD
MHTDNDNPPPNTAFAGVIMAVAAFLIWGLSPVYWKALQAVPPFQILLHRIIWSFFFLIPIVVWQGRWPEFIRVFRSPRVLIILMGTTLIVAVNWFLFIWAINTGRVLQTSLGYYINPLVNVLLGTVLLRERLRRPQVFAVLLAFGAVAYLTLSYGQFPWLALAIAITFGFYGLIRKVAPVSAIVGLAIETLLLTIPAAVVLFYLDQSGEGRFLHVSLEIDMLLVGAALVTGLPLWLFTRGARRLHLSTVGFLQYIAPSCTFLLAVFVYHEPFARTQLKTFLLIWSALAIYSYDSWHAYRAATHERQALPVDKLP